MAIKVVLFDLDGTLLPMDQEAFTKRYFKLLAQKLAPRGYDPKQLIDCIWAGTVAMVKNDGSCKNEEAFWNKFSELLGDHVREDEPIFDAFYRNEFSGAKEACGFNPKAAEAVAKGKAAGLRVALATNPLFPAIATENRIRWAGLNPEEFELYTTYENSCFCKPNPKYYLEIVSKLGVEPEECLMVGNDVGEDMVAESLGMKVFLLSDCLINKSGKDISKYPQGGFDRLMEYITEING